MHFEDSLRFLSSAPATCSPDSASNESGPWVEGLWRFALSILPDTPDTGSSSLILTLGIRFLLSGSAPDTAVSPSDTPAGAPSSSGCRVLSGDCRADNPTGLSA